MKNRNRRLRRVLLALCSVLALVAISVGATLAYLTDTEAVTNVFTVGKIDISLDESDLKADGTLDTSKRVTANEYHLVPGQTYPKDPTVHVKAISEDCYVFVKVENGLSAIETTESTKTIAAQIAAKGWTLLDGETGVYYRLHEQKNGAQDYRVFDSFTLAGEGLDNATLAIYSDAKITITAYAIQKAGFDSAADAWKAGDGQWTPYDSNP